MGGNTSRETPESVEIVAKECKHKHVFDYEHKEDTWFGGYDYYWHFKCEHCGHERTQPAPYAWDDDRNWGTTY